MNNPLRVAVALLTAFSIPQSTAAQDLFAVGYRGTVVGISTATDKVTVARRFNGNEIFRDCAVRPGGGSLLVTEIRRDKYYWLHAPTLRVETKIRSKIVRPSNLVMTPDGRYALGSRFTSGAIETIDLESRRRVDLHVDPTRAYGHLSYSRGRLVSSNIFVAATMEMLEFDPSRRRNMLRHRRDGEGVGSAYVGLDAQFAPDGESIAFWSPWQNAIFTLNSRMRLRSRGPELSPGITFDMAFSADGTTLMLVSNTGEVSGYAYQNGRIGRLRWKFRTPVPSWNYATRQIVVHPTLHRAYLTGFGLRGIIVLDSRTGTKIKTIHHQYLSGAYDRPVGLCIDGYSK